MDFYLSDGRKAGWADPATGAHKNFYACACGYRTRCFDCLERAGYTVHPEGVTCPSNRLARR